MASYISVVIIYRRRSSENIGLVSSEWISNINSAMQTNDTCLCSNLCSNAALQMCNQYYHRHDHHSVKLDIPPTVDFPTPFSGPVHHESCFVPSHHAIHATNSIHEMRHGSPCSRTLTPPWPLAATRDWSITPLWWRSHDRISTNQWSGLLLVILQRTESDQQ